MQALILCEIFLVALLAADKNELSDARNFNHSHFLHFVGLFLTNIRAWCNLRCPYIHLSYWLIGAY